MANVSSKTGKKCIFCVFRPFLSLCRPASRPYGLKQIKALRINQSYYLKDQSMKYWRKLLSFWRSWKTQFFWVGHFEFFFSKFFFFFCFIPMKISHKLCVRMNGTQFLLLWWFTARNKGGNHKWAWVYCTSYIVGFFVKKLCLLILYFLLHFCSGCLCCATFHITR
jgi:hypothetical protein